MSWTAAGSALTDHARFIRVLNEATMEPRGGNLVIPGRYGEYAPLQKFYSGSDVILEFGLVIDNAHSHLASLMGIFSKPVVLSRTDHPAGTVQATVNLDGGIRQTQDRFTFAFPLRRHEGAWEDAAVSTATGTSPTIATGGDQVIGDPVVTFSAPGTATLVTDFGTAVAEWAGTGTAIMDSGARTIVKGGVAQDALFEINSKYWFRFQPDTTVNLTSSVSLTVDWRNKHA
jgi:hypothetical protein